MSDLEFEWASDQEVSQKHSELLDAVGQLDRGQRIKKLEHYEPSLEISEFSTTKRATETLDQDALGINGKKIKAKLKSAPLEKPTAERIKRTVGFENTKKELGKWAGIIARNRTAACVSFPLSQTSMKLEGTDEYVKRFRLQSELEKKLAEVDKVEEIEEIKDEFPLTLQEILERRHEAAKFRAQQSYKAAKATRQKKIKSKKYHRIQRKEKIKKALKEFEELQKVDPQAALEKLEQLDRARAEERMTLRHKSTGQWAKSKQVRAKYDKESRQVLAAQLSISKELTQKVKKDEDSEDDEDENDVPLQPIKGDNENPWINPVKSQSEIDDFISGYRKYWDEKNKSQKEKESKPAENKKIFDELEIQDTLKSKNSAEVFEKGSSKVSGLANEGIEGKKNNGIDSNKLKKLEKSSKGKLGLKLTVNKRAKSKKSVIVGTSSWSISPVDSPIVINQHHDKDSSQVIAIDEIFDPIDDKIQDKITRKLAKLKRELEREEKYEKKIKRKSQKGKPKCEKIDDVEKLGLIGEKLTRPIIDKPIEETTKSLSENQSSAIENIKNISEFNKQVSLQSNKTEIDPNKFIKIKPKHIKTTLPDELGGEEQVLDETETEDQYQIISEAFADDDVVDEFRKEKEEEIKNSQPEDIDLRLPGWGSWGGKNIKHPLRKKRRFIIKTPKEIPRRDENKGDVVIIEEKCPKIKQHLVNELPFPFNSVKDFESSIRAPVGRDFVPEKTFSKLITPHVKTKMGKIIEPMTEDVLVKTDNLKKRKRPARKDEKVYEKKKRRGKSASKAHSKVTNGRPIS